MGADHDGLSCGQSSFKSSLNFLDPCSDPYRMWVHPAPEALDRGSWPVPGKALFHSSGQTVHKEFLSCKLYLFQKLLRTVPRHKAGKDPAGGEKSMYSQTFLNCRRDPNSSGTYPNSLFLPAPFEITGVQDRMWAEVMTCQATFFIWPMRSLQWGVGCHWQIRCIISERSLW